MKVEMKWNRLLDIRVILTLLIVIPSVLINKEVDSFVIGILLINVVSYLMDIGETLKEINNNIKRGIIR